jgi:hypothetical protein
MVIFRQIFLLHMVLIQTIAYPIVLYLAQFSSERNNNDLERSLISLNQHFMQKHNHFYPVVVAFDNKEKRYLTDGLKKIFSGALGADIVPCSTFPPLKNVTQLCFAPVKRFRHVPWPFSLYQNDYSEENPYYSRLGYRNMCRFWAISVFQQSFMKNVTMYFRLDTDSYLINMPTNPFELLKSRKTSYIHAKVYKESSYQVDGLWETMLRFAVLENIHPYGLHSLANDYHEHSKEELKHMNVKDAANELLNRGYNLDYFYNNWEFSLVAIWKSDIYQKLSLYIDQSGGIIMRRWGDAPIRTMALHLLADSLSEFYTQNLFEQYVGLEYFHKANHKT